MKFKIDVLGTKYTVKYEDGKKDEFLRNNSTVAGYTNRINKAIGIKPHSNKNYISEVVLHELTHAYLNESGITTYGSQGVNLHSEFTCEWIANNFNKIANSYNIIINKIYPPEKKKVKKKKEKK